MSSVTSTTEFVNGVTNYRNGPQQWTTTDRNGRRLGDRNGGRLGHREPQRGRESAVSPIARSPLARSSDCCDRLL